MQSLLAKLRAVRVDPKIGRRRECRAACTLAGFAGPDDPTGCMSRTDGRWPAVAAMAWLPYFRPESPLALVAQARTGRDWMSMSEASEAPPAHH